MRTPGLSPHLPLALGMLYAAGTALAHAQSTPMASVSTTLNQLTYELVDLDTADNITPSISFLANPAILVDADLYQPNLPGRYVSRSTAGSIEVIDLSGKAQASVSDSSWRSFATINGDLEHWVQYKARTMYTLGFQLTPATGVHFKALADIDLDNQPNTHLDSSMVFRAYANSDANGIRQSSSFNDHYGFTQGDHELTLGGYVHSYAGMGYGSLYIETTSKALVAGPVLAVPEPQTCAMLLAGLGMVGAGALRRRRGAN